MVQINEGNRANLLQETKQLTLEEIDLLFGDRALGTLPDDLGEKATHVLHTEDHLQPNA
jgi:hypothetical protein